MDQAESDIAPLIAAARLRDRQAFGELYHRTMRPVFRYLAARTATEDEAEELTQEVFLAALRGIDSLRADNEMGLMGWLFQIARYKLADSLRSRYRAGSVPLDTEHDFPSDQPEPDELVEASSDREAVRLAMERLTPEQREVLLCKYLLDYDNQQTGEHLGKNANAINQLHHRALASLRRMLTTEAQA